MNHAVPREVLRLNRLIDATVDWARNGGNLPAGVYAGELYHEVRESLESPRARIAKLEAALREIRIGATRSGDTDPREVLEAIDLISARALLQEGEGDDNPESAPTLE